MKYILPLVFIINFALVGCATAPEKMGKAHVSSFKYAEFTCSQLISEADELDQRIPLLHSQLKKTADDDEAQMAISLILFWPALFFLEYGDGPQAVEYRQLLGERDAITKMARKKDCSTIKAAPIPGVGEEFIVKELKELKDRYERNEMNKSEYDELRKQLIDKL